MASAWGVSWGAAWGNSWGVVDTPTPSAIVGGGSYLREYRKKEDFFDLTLQERRDELQKIQDEIDAAQRAAAEEQAAIEAAALELRAQEEINRLRELRDWLMRMIDDEEAVIALLLMRPFH